MSISGDLIRLHVNTYRQIHNSPPVAYHAGQASFAQARAQEILERGGVRLPASSRSEGENVLVFATAEADDTKVVKLAVDAWYQYFNDYDFSDPGNTDSSTEMFTQLIWKSTRRIGAGVARTSSQTGPQKSAVVVMRFDPPGNRIDRFATNVLPFGIDNLVLDDFYTKTQSDDRFLSINGLDSYVSLLEAGAIEAAEQRVHVFRDVVNEEFYRKYEVHDRFVALDAFFGLSNLLEGQYITESNVQSLLSDASLEADSNVSGLSNAVQDRVRDIYSNIHRIDSNVNELDTEFMSRLTSQITRFESLSNVLYREYYTEDQLHGKFATLSDLSNVADRTYNKLEMDEIFATASNLVALSNFIGDNFLDKNESDERYALQLDHDLLRNDLREDYYTRTVSDQKYAGAVDFRGLSNFVANDYMTRDESVRSFAAGSDLYALSNVLSQDYFDKQTSDTIFARSNVLLSLTELVDIHRQDHVSLSNAYVGTVLGNILCNIDGIDNDDKGLRFSIFPYRQDGHDKTSNIRFFNVSNVVDSGTGSSYQSNVELMRLREDGYVGIGTTDPQATLHVAGEVYSTLGFTQASDCNLKTDIRPIDDALTKICKIGGYTYRYRMLSEDTRLEREKNDVEVAQKKRRAGVLAQEVLHVLPEAVCKSGTTYGVDYGDIVALLIEAVKELCRVIIPGKLNPNQEESIFHTEKT